MGTLGEGKVFVFVVPVPVPVPANTDREFEIGSSRGGRALRPSPFETPVSALLASWWSSIMKSSADDTSDPPPSSWAARLDPRLRASQPVRPPGSWAEAPQPSLWIEALKKRSAGDVALDVALAASLVGLVAFYRSFLRRIPQHDDILPWFWRRRSLLGTVTSVGDGDGFRLFHTPGGRLTGWGWLRKVPQDRKELLNRTISIRLAGVDAPEGAHFGRPAQPFAAEALNFLTSYVEGRRVRAYIYRRDQYERVIATAFVRKPPFFFPRRDIGLELLHRGLATMYEGKTGSEFGGFTIKAAYRAAEEAAKAKQLGMWNTKAHGRLRGVFSGQATKAPLLESPAAYKARWREIDALKEANVLMRKTTADGGLPPPATAKSRSKTSTRTVIAAKKSTRMVSTSSMSTETARKARRERKI